MTNDSSITSVTSSGRSRAVRFALAGILAFSVALTGVGLASASPASAATSSCGSGSCTVYLTKGETLALSQGRVPKLNLGALTVPFTALAVGHVLIAKGWVARGMCVGFTLNVRPWATQGMFGYRCS